MGFLVVLYFSLWITFIWVDSEKMERFTSANELNSVTGTV